jgi:hypothetical protein
MRVGFPNGKISETPQLFPQAVHIILLLSPVMPSPVLRTLSDTTILRNRAKVPVSILRRFLQNLTVGVLSNFAKMLTGTLARLAVALKRRLGLTAIGTKNDRELPGISRYVGHVGLTNWKGVLHRDRSATEESHSRSTFRMVAPSAHSHRDQQRAASSASYIVAS